MAGSTGPPEHHAPASRRFLPPWWTALFPVAITLAFAGWRTATAARPSITTYLAALLWPGAAVFLAFAAMVWLAWALDID